MFSSGARSSDAPGQTHYIPNESSTAQKLQDKWEIVRDGRSETGDVYTDNVTVGGLTVPSQTIEVAKRSPSDIGWDGIFGLGVYLMDNIRRSPNSFFEKCQRYP